MGSHDSPIKATNTVSDAFMFNGEDNNNLAATVNFQSRATWSHPVCAVCDREPQVPRVLNCLHSFCQECLVGLSIPVDLHSLSITCPTCAQVTFVGPTVNQLLPDFISLNAQDAAKLQSVLNAHDGQMEINCDSCKSKDAANARCFDCGWFLCGRCEAAHRQMTRFDKHHVMTFAEMKSSEQSLKPHRPVTCPVHQAEVIKYFCKSCQLAICHECQYSTHKVNEHMVVKVDEDLHKTAALEIQILVKRGKELVAASEKDADVIVQEQRDLMVLGDLARERVKDAFFEYRRLLDKREEEICGSIDNVVTRCEEKMGTAEQNVRLTTSRINDGCKFAEKIVAGGNAAEILLSRNAVISQLENLTVRFTGVPRMQFKLDFVAADLSRFAQILQMECGTFESGCRIKSPTAEQELSPSSMLGIENSISNGTFDSSFTTHGNPNGDFVPLDSTITASYAARLASGANSLATAIAAGQPRIDFNRPPPPLSGVLANMFQTNGVGRAPTSALSVFTAGYAQSNDDSQSLASAPLSNTSSYNSGYHSALQDMEYASNGFVPPQRPLSTVSSNGPLVSPLQSSRLENSWPRRQHHDSSMSNSMSEPPCGNEISRRVRTPMQLRCKSGTLGPLVGQLNSPHGFCFGQDEDIVVADTNNHRIQTFNKLGLVKQQFGIAGKEDGQLWYPRKVAVFTSTGKVVVCDRGNERSRMQIFTKNGFFLKKIGIRYMDIVAALTITKEGNICAIDSVSPSVFIISENGDLLRWFDCSPYMSEPSDVAIYMNEFYITDFKAFCVAVFSEEGKFIRRLGCKDITPYPNGIDVSRNGDVLVGNSHGNTFNLVAFTRDGQLVAEFECPQVKVSRCCGLKITSEGYIVTLAKNNHHILVVDTLYLS